MSEQLRKFMIVRYCNNGPTRECDSEAEEMGVVLADTPEQAIELFCRDQNVRPWTAAYHEGRNFNEWYVAEEVD